MKKTTCLLCALMCLSACAPNVSVGRFAHRPARTNGCKLDFIRDNVQSITLQNKLQMIGTVTIQDDGIVDPLAPKYRDIVRPQACALGGTAVGLLVSHTNEEPLAIDSSSMVYAVFAPKTTHNLSTNF